MLKNEDDEKETMQCCRSAIASNLHQIVTSSVVRVTCVGCLAASGPVTWCDVRLLIVRTIPLKGLHTTCAVLFPVLMSHGVTSDL